ncbi:hypothetical protein ATANTOWER_004880, partial [Ataeniobius toweri]|nr:hypothetical protein [Ataeniobius toweri]
MEFACSPRACGGSQAERTQPPTTAVEASSSSLSDDGAEEDEKYLPPARQLSLRLLCSVA